MQSSAVNIADRSSYLSSVSKAAAKADGNYEGVKTPGELEGGALRQGGAPSLLSRESFGLLAQYAGVGMILGTLPSTAYPVLQNYFNGEGTMITSATTLINIPWSFKVFYGILSDCFPIFGLRRRPYMILGWGICCLMLFIMASTPLPPPFYGDPAVRSKPPANWTEEDKKTLNLETPEKAGKYVIYMMLAAFGYLMADVAADAVVVEYAQREPEAIRGRTQTAIYTVRTVFNVLAQFLMMFGFNGKEYGGDFDFSISFPMLMLILGIFCLPLLPLTWFFVTEVKVEAPKFTTYIGEFWEVLQQRAVYQVIFYNFISSFFSSFTYVASSNIQSYWVKAAPLTTNVTSIIGDSVFAITLAVTGKYGLGWNWRTVTAITTVIVIAMDSVVTMITVWDVFRNEWFWLGYPILENLPAGINFIVGTYVVVELADEGNEGAIYGLLTTCSNLARPFARTISKNVNAPFNVWRDDIQRDDYVARRDVTITIMITYGMSLLSLAFLPLLPPQKAAVRELKAKGGKSKLLGAITLFYVSFAMVWSMMVNIMGMYKSTKCHPIVGGCKR